MVGVFHMENIELTIRKAEESLKRKYSNGQLLTKRKLRDILWSTKFRPTPQEISVRRVQVYVDTHPIEMVQLSLNEVSAVELLKGLTK